MMQYLSKGAKAIPNHPFLLLADEQQQLEENFLQSSGFCPHLPIAIGIFSL